MAVLQVEFHSETLKRMVSFKAILPTERFQAPYPTLYLLHGLTDNASAWLYNTKVRLWAEEMGLAVVLPTGENSFYLDVPVKDGCYGDFGEYIGRELVEVTREMFPLSHRREDTFIGGLSMGGYGACRNGLKYCDTFGKVAVLSGAVHFFENSRQWVMTEGNTIGELQCFGDLDKMENTDRNPRYLIRAVQERNKKDGTDHFPDFYVACGTKDHLIGANRSLAAALKEAGANVFYEDGPGIHDWYFWGEYIRHVLDWLQIKAQKKEGAI